MNKNLSKSTYKLALAAICALTSSLGHAAASSVSEGGRQLSYKWGLSDMKGGRSTMEDAHKIVIPYKDIPGQAFFGVYDGHGGSIVARYAEQHLDTNIANFGLVAGFERTDVDLAQFPHLNMMGTTAVVAVTEKQPDNSLKLSFAWAGDARGILINKAGEVVYATIDHKPDTPAEKARIEAAGGQVMHWGVWRVDGQLAVARAIGDRSFGNKVPATPDVKEIRLNQDAAFIILACDGLWDEVSNEEATRMVTEIFARGDSSLPDDTEPNARQEGNDNIAIKAARTLRNAAYDHAAADSRRSDNISVLVVKLDWEAVPTPSVRKAAGPSAAVTSESLSKGLDDILSRAAMSASNNVALNGAVELLKNAQVLLSYGRFRYALEDLDEILKHPGSREMIDRIEKRKLKDEIDRIVSSVDLFAEGSLSNELNKFLAQRGVTASGNANVDKVVRSLQSANFFAGEDDISRALDLIDGARELAGELTVDVAVGQQALGDMIRDIIR